jgi:hypothetical protein
MHSNLSFKVSAGLISAIFYVSGLGYHDQIILASHLVHFFVICSFLSPGVVSPCISGVRLKITLNKKMKWKMLFRYRMLFHPEISPLKLVLFVLGTLS